MGCDIHLFAEACFGSSGYEAIADGEFRMARDYRLFSALAGVRAEPSFVPMFPPRGIPNNISQHISDRYFVPVVDSGKAGAWQIGTHFTPEQARRLVKGNKSRWLQNGITPPLTPSTDGYIVYPDWHSASWLTLDEVRLSLKHAGYALTEAPEESQLLVEYLSSFTERIGATTRVVFWFDN